jgi:hypothetical protein
MEAHQIVRLSQGSHRNPNDGVCVMELASMLAGERFSDKPRSVSPVIAGFLRTYNDALDDDMRKDLYPYAARVVGTRAPRSVERLRARRCVEWTREMGGDAPRLMRLRPSWVAGQVAAAFLSERGCPVELHLRALALVDELVALGDRWAAIPPDPGDLAGGRKRGRASRVRSASGR